MVQINFALKEVNCKIVYYGPGMSGKTTNLEVVHRKAPEANKGERVMAKGDRQPSPEEVARAKELAAEFRERAVKRACEAPMRESE